MAKRGSATCHSQLSLLVARFKSHAAVELIADLLALVALRSLAAHAAASLWQTLCGAFGPANDISSVYSQMLGVSTSVQFGSAKPSCR